MKTRIFERPRICVFWIFEVIKSSLQTSWWYNRGQCVVDHGRTKTQFVVPRSVNKNELGQIKLGLKIVQFLVFETDLKIPKVFYFTQK